MKIHESLNTVSSTSKVAAVIFFGALIVSAFYVGIWYERNLINSTQPPAVALDPTQVPTATPTAMVTATPTSVATADKTFTSDTYKYSFKYPSNKAIAKLPNASVPDSYVFVTNTGQSITENTDTLRNSVISINVSEETSPHDWSQFTDYSSTSKPVTVGGIKGTEYTVKNISDNSDHKVVNIGEQFRETHFTTNGHFFFNVTTFSADNNYDAANKIISTFQFK